MREQDIRDSRNRECVQYVRASATNRLEWRPTFRVSLPTVAVELPEGIEAWSRVLLVVPWKGISGVPIRLQTQAGQAWKRLS